MILGNFNIITGIFPAIDALLIILLLSYISSVTTKELKNADFPSKEHDDLENIDSFLSFMWIILPVLKTFFYAFVYSYNFSIIVTLILGNNLFIILLIIQALRIRDNKITILAIILAIFTVIWNLNYLLMYDQWFNL